MAENMSHREELDHQCIVCRDIWHRDVDAEVYHRNARTRKKSSAELQPGLSVCMDCILSDRLLHGNTSGQVKAFKMLRECVLPGCGGKKTVPMWFCYDCFKYLCNECKHTAEHSCEGKQVGYKKTTFKLKFKSTQIADKYWLDLFDVEIVVMWPLASTKYIKLHIYSKEYKWV